MRIGINEMQNRNCETDVSISGLEKKVTERIVKELKQRGIKQVELLKLCESARIRMPISQPDISKIYSGKKTLSLYQFAAVCKVLDMPMDYFVWGEDGNRDDFCNPHDSANLHDSGDELKCYVGQYHLYYLSTAQGEEKILKGVLNIAQEKEFGQVRLEIDTGEVNRRGIQIQKVYEGRILVSSSLGAAYLIFKNESIGEMCMMCLRHRNYSVKDMECRIGLALTMSAGELKEPTAHRCLVLRDFLDGKQLEELRSWLKLISDSFSIERDLLEKIIEQVKEKHPDYASQLDRVQKSASPKIMSELSSEVLRRQLLLGRNEFVDFLTRLYEQADVNKNYKVSQFDDIRFYDKINSIRDAEAMKANADAGMPSG